MTAEPTAQMKVSLEHMRRRELENAEGARPAVVVETYLAMQKTRTGLYKRGYVTHGKGAGCFVLTRAGRDYADEMMAGERVSEALKS